MQKNTARYFAQCLQEVSTLHIIEICIGEFDQEAQIKWPEKLRQYAPTKKHGWTLFEHQPASASISINQHQLASVSISINQNYPASAISINQHQSVSASIRIKQHQSASISINWHQSASISINRHTSVSISINQCQCANVIVNQKKIFVVWHKCLKLYILA